MSDIAGEFVCPITIEPATLSARNGDYLEITCPTCETYQISATALEVEIDGPEVLLFALEQAKSAAVPGEVPMIKNISG